MDYNWLTPKAQMRVTPGKGSGSFAISKISKGEIVASFGGNVINQTDLTNYSADRVSRSLQLNNDIGSPGIVSGSHVIYSRAESTGKSGIYFVNTENTRDELVSKNRALLFSMLF